MPMNAESFPARLAAALEGSYRIRRELGRGGMAIVYLADDIKHDRKVALKVLKPELAAVIGAERFVVEIKTTAALQHPHVLPLFDSGTADGFLYYVMPFIDGETLRERLTREGQLGLDEARTIALEIADGLSYAHSLGVIHRDIKPENILLSGGHAVLADFGIARAVGASGGERLTETGMALGTPTYMSPEQALGETESIDHRSDEYALGCVLYEMFAGDPPFTGTSPHAILARKTLEAPPPLRSVRHTLSPAVERVILRSVARAKADRYRTVAEFADALRQAPLEAEDSFGGVPAPATASMASLREWSQSRRAALLIVSAGVVGITALAIRSSRAPAPPPLRIATLPCYNRSQTDTGHRADGMTLGLISHLTRVPSLAPLSFSSTERFRDRTVGAGEIARRLDADYVIECDLLQGEGELRMGIAVVREDDVTTWRKEYPYQASVDGLIAEDVIAALGVTQLDAEIAQIRRTRTISPQADSLYRLGLVISERNYSARASERVVELYDAAIAADSSFALAYAKQSMAYSLLGRNFYTSHPPTEWYPLARRAAEAAQRLDPELAEGHLAMAFVRMWFDWDWRGAERDIAEAERLAPNLAKVSAAQAHLFSPLGRHEEALSAAKRAYELDPLNPVQPTNIGWVLFLAGRIDEAIEQYRVALASAPDYQLAENVLAWALVIQGRREEAAALVDDREEGFRSWVTLFHRGLAGDLHGPNEIVDYVSGWQKNGVSAPHSTAELYALAGEPDSAFVWLERAYLERVPYMVRLRIDPSFANLRGDPRFDDLVTRIGF